MSDLHSKPQDVETQDVSTTSASERWLQRSMTVSLLLAALYLVSNNIADPDLWGHVQYGRDVIRDGIIHPTTTYSFTAEGYRWINHENLSELVMAVTVDTMGLYGLLLGKFLLAAFVFLVILRCGIKHGLSVSAAGLLVLLAAANLAFHWSFRPQLMSFFFCTVMLWILDFSFKGWQEHYLKKPADLDAEDADCQHKFNTMRVRLLWLMPVVLCLWANSHGGFVAGLGIYIAYLAGRTIEAFYWRGPRAWGIARRFTMMAAVGVLGTLLNPYGPDLHLWLLKSLGEPRPEITDWYGVSLTSVNGARLLLAAAFSAIAFIFTQRKRDWTQITILSLVLWQSIMHVRHIPFFALLMSFWIAPHLASTLAAAKQKMKKGSEQLSTKFKTQMLCCGHAVVLLMMLGLCGWKLSDLPVEKEKFPVEAFQFIADNDLDGRMVVTYNWAQYAIGTFGGNIESLPHCPVAFDGRFRTCYPQEVVDMHFDFVMGDQGPGSRSRSPKSPPIDGTRVLKHGDPELVVISRRQKPSVNVMNRMEESWTLLYQDALAQVWGLKSRFDDPTSSDFLAMDQRLIGDKPQLGSVSWPALPQQASTENRRRQKSPGVPALRVSTRK